LLERPLLFCLHLAGQELGEHLQELGIPVIDAVAFVADRAQAPIDGAVRKVNRHPHVRADARLMGDFQVLNPWLRGGVRYGVGDLARSHQPAVTFLQRQPFVQRPAEGCRVSRQAAVHLLAVAELGHERKDHVQVPASQLQNPVQTAAFESVVDMTHGVRLRIVVVERHSERPRCGRP
jgi:hypothetical protein